MSRGALGDGPMVLLAAEIRRLREMDKIVGFDWQVQLLARVNAVGQHRVAILDLTTGPTRGELHVFAREGVNRDDYSTGLVLYDLSNAPTTILRLNGPHPNPHKNRFPRRVTLPVGPHAHYLTERYQREHLLRRKPEPDGFALRTSGYRDLRGALDALARRAHILPATPQLPLAPVKRLP